MCQLIYSNHYKRSTLKHHIGSYVHKIAETNIRHMRRLRQLKKQLLGNILMTRNFGP